MKSVSFLCPYETVFKLLLGMVKKKGFTVLESDRETGNLIAFHKKTLFKKAKTLSIKVSKVDARTTAVQVMINNNSAISDKPRNWDEFEEERIIHSVHKCF